jgi:hypothetical protein
MANPFAGYQPSDAAPAAPPVAPSNPYTNYQPPAAAPIAGGENPFTNYRPPTVQQAAPQSAQPAAPAFNNPLAQLFPTNPLQAHGVLSNAVTSARNQISKAGVAPTGLPAEAMTMRQLPYYQGQAIGATNQRVQQQQDLAKAAQQALAPYAQLIQAHPALGRVVNFSDAAKQGAMQAGAAGQSLLSPQAGHDALQGLEINTPVVPGPEATAGRLVGGIAPIIGASAVNPLLGAAVMSGQAAGQARSDIQAQREAGTHVSGIAEAGQAIGQGAAMGLAGLAFGSAGKFVSDAISGLAPEAASAVASGDASALQAFTTKALAAAGKSGSGATINIAAQTASNLIKKGVDPNTAITQSWDSAGLIGLIVPHFSPGGEAPTRDAGESQSRGGLEPGKAPKAPLSESGASNFEPQRPAETPPEATAKATPAQPVQPELATQSKLPVGHEFPEQTSSSSRIKELIAGGLSEEQAIQQGQKESEATSQAHKEEIATLPKGTVVRAGSYDEAPRRIKVGPGPDDWADLDKNGNPIPNPKGPGVLEHPTMGYGQRLEGWQIESLPGETSSNTGADQFSPRVPTEADSQSHQPGQQMTFMDALPGSRYKGIAALPSREDIAGPGSIYGEEVKPVLARASQALSSFGKLFPVERADLKSTLTGEAPDDLASLAFRKSIATAANEHLQAMQSLEAARKGFATQPVENQHSFMAAMYDGKTDKLPPEQQAVAVKMHEITDSRRQAIADLWAGKDLGEAAKQWKTQWFNTLWQKDNSARPLNDRINRPGPLGGKTGAGLLQPRTNNDFQEGVNAGLRPVHSNPVDMFAATDAAQRQFIGAGRAVKALDASDELTRVTDEEKVPHNMMDVTPFLPKAFRDLVSGDPKEDGERILASQQTADILRNVMTPSALSKSVIYEAARKTSNGISQAILGLSGFHIKKIALEGILLDASRLVGKGNMSRGQDLLEPGINATGIGRIARGKTIQQQMLSPDMKNLEGMAPETSKIIQAMRGSVSAETDPFYKNSVEQKMRRAWQQGGLQGAIRAGLRVPFAALEHFSQEGIFKVVQHSKLAYIHDSLGDFLKANPDASPIDTERAAAKASDTADRILGLMQRDNLFWNKTARDILSLGFLSVGWQYGTLRSFAGALHEGAEATRIAPMLRKLFGQGYEPQKMTQQNRQQLIYWLTTAAMMGSYNALKTYLHTGHGPQSLTDYVYPPKGQKDSQGRDIREHGVSYLGDMFGFIDHPIASLEAKAGPVPRLISQIGQNKNEGGQQIVDPEATLHDKAMQIAKYVGQTFEPIALGNALKVRESPEYKQAPWYSKLDKMADAFYGERSASVQYSESSAEQLARHMMQSDRPVTAAQSAHEQLIDEFSNRYRQQDTSVLADIAKAMQSGQLTSQDRNEIRQRAKEPADWTHLLKRGLDDSQLMQVFGAMTPEEQSANAGAVYKRIVKSKLTGQSRRDALTTLENAMMAKQGQPQTQPIQQ